MKKDAPTGVYRIIYDYNNNGYIDFIFNNETVEFWATPHEDRIAIQFTKSNENQLYLNYLNDQQNIQQKLEQIQINYLQNPSLTLKDDYQNNLINLEKFQKEYEQKSKGMFAHLLITTSKMPNPKHLCNSPDEYLDEVRKQFLNFINFNNPKLWMTPILSKKVNAYLFSLNQTNDKQEREKVFKESVNILLEQIENPSNKKKLLHYLVTSLTEGKEAPLVEWIINKHYHSLPQELKDQKFIDNKIEKLAIIEGKPAPNFEWSENGKKYSLSTIDEADNYLLIFWSTECPHCTKSIPLIYEYMKKYQKIKVIAYALEKEETKWKRMIKDLKGWHHVIATNPESIWKNPISDEYKIDGTPSYFIIDKNKKIVKILITMHELKNVIEELNSNQPSPQK